VGLAQGFIDNGYDNKDSLDELIKEKRDEFKWDIFGGSVSTKKDTLLLNKDLKVILGGGGDVNSGGTSPRPIIAPKAITVNVVL
jgi:hypothetical protein